MKKMENIENLRKFISDAKEDSVLGDEFVMFIKHPQLTWKDMIDLLKFKIVFGEYASFKLHDYLGVPFPKNGPIRNPKKWYKILEDRAIKPSDTIQES